MHALLNLHNKTELEGHPKIGASWEGFAMNTVLTQLDVHSDEAFFWSTHIGAELDLLVFRGNQRLGFEFKRTVSPALTRSIPIAIADLNLSHVYIVNANNDIYPLAANVTAIGLSQIAELTGGM